MAFSSRKRLLQAAKYLALSLGLCGVYKAWFLFGGLAADGDMILTAGQKITAAAALLPGEAHLRRHGSSNPHGEFRRAYYALGRTLNETPPAFPAARAFIEAVTPEFYALQPVVSEVSHHRRGSAVAAAADAEFTLAAGRIARLCLVAAKSNAAERNRWLVRTGLAYFALFTLLLLLEWADHCFTCKPLFEAIAGLNQKIWLHTYIPELKLSGSETEIMRAGVDSLLTELQAAKSGWARLEQEAAARQARLKIQSRSLELARKKVMALVDDLEETRGELQTEKKALRTAGEKLERSNKELEQFAYVASHDLKEPLRIVTSFSALLSKRYADRLDADAADFIRYISEGARRSSELIEALFNYSKVTYSTREFTVVPAMTALQKAMFNLKLAIEDKKARIICDELPPLMVNEFQLIQLFQNLIANSLKFNTSAEPEIRVGFTGTPETWTLSFSDNGIGIAPEHFERIFLVFQRLHSQEKYPGAGIGLALCKKIAENHGGRIWVESGPGTGSTFFVEFPRHEEEQAAACGATAPELANKAD